MQPAVEGHIERVGIPESIAADSAFDDDQTLRFLDGQGIVAHVTSRDHSKPRNGGYGTDRISWQEGQEHPFCADQQPLLPVGKARKDGRQSYQGAGCGSCKLYERCNPNGSGAVKKYTINPDSHKRWQENRQANQSSEYKAAHRSRFASEGRFGLAKTNHKADRAPYRSDDMNLIAALMIATMMNFRILANHKVSYS